MEAENATIFLQHCNFCNESEIILVNDLENIDQSILTLERFDGSNYAKLMCPIKLLKHPQRSAGQLSYIHPFFGTFLPFLSILHSLPLLKISRKIYFLVLLFELFYILLSVNIYVSILDPDCASRVSFPAFYV